MSTPTDIPTTKEMLTEGWQALARTEWERGRSLFEAAASRDESAEALEGLRVNSDRMLQNLMLDGGAIAAEAMMIHLAHKLGRERAHDLVRAPERNASRHQVIGHVGSQEQAGCRLFRASPIQRQTTHHRLRVGQTARVRDFCAKDGLLVLQQVLGQAAGQTGPKVVHQLSAPQRTIQKPENPSGKERVDDVVDCQPAEVDVPGQANKHQAGHQAGGVGIARAGGRTIDIGIWVLASLATGTYTFWAWLILDLNRQLQATFMVVTHDIATARRVADYIGMLYRRNLVKFGPAREMFDSEIPVVRQFLSGESQGPLGME